MSETRHGVEARATTVTVVAVIDIAVRVLLSPFFAGGCLTWAGLAIEGPLWMRTAFAATVGIPLLVVLLLRPATSVWPMLGLTALAVIVAAAAWISPVLGLVAGLGFWLAVPSV